MLQIFISTENETVEGVTEGKTLMLLTFFKESVGFLNTFLHFQIERPNNINENL